MGELLVKVVVDVVECWWCWFCCCLHTGKRYASKAIEVFYVNDDIDVDADVVVVVVDGVGVLIKKL